MPSSSTVQPYPVPFCVRASVKCIDVEISRLRSLQRRFGCDHRGVFSTTYLELTRELRQTLAKRPHFFTDPKYLYREDALFANVYFNSVKAWFGGRPVPEAWQVAFETAAKGDVNGAQDMLLGINAHVQNDMPFVLAALGQRRPNGDTRKPDHDRMTDVLDAAYERVVRSIEDRFDPFMATTTPAGPSATTSPGSSWSRSGARTCGATPSACWPRRRRRSAPTWPRASRTTPAAGRA